MKNHLILLLLGLAFGLSSCYDADCMSPPPYENGHELIVYVKKDSNHSFDDELSLVGLNKKTDTRLAWKEDRKRIYIDSLGNFSYDSTFITYNLIFPLNKKSNESAFLLIYKNQLDTLIFRHKSVLEEQSIGPCNENKFAYHISDIKLEKITFDTLANQKDEYPNYYYYGNSNTIYAIFE
jgi:hypothetical protein